MGFEMKITGSDGRRYNSPGDMMEAETKRMLDDHVEAVARAIRATRCPVHGEYAQSTPRKTSNGYSFDISGCCDDLLRRAQSAADRAG